MAFKDAEAFDKDGSTIVIIIFQATFIFIISSFKVSSDFAQALKAVILKTPSALPNTQEELRIYLHSGMCNMTPLQASILFTIRPSPISTNTQEYPCPVT